MAATSDSGTATEVRGYLWLCRVTELGVHVSQVEPLQPQIYGENGQLANSAGRIVYRVRECRSWTFGTGPRRGCAAIDVTEIAARRAAMRLWMQHWGRQRYDD
jgi:hypothetical protein